jgi:hypothetical protein
MKIKTLQRMKTRKSKKSKHSMSFLFTPKKRTFYWFFLNSSLSENRFLLRLQKLIRSLLFEGLF